jgi:hypothetical protein
VRLAVVLLILDLLFNALGNLRVGQLDHRYPALLGCLKRLDPPLLLSDDDLGLLTSSVRCLPQCSG